MSLSSENVHPGGRSDGRAAREMCLFAEAVQLDEFKKSPAGQVTESEVWPHADDGDYVPAAAVGQSSGAEEGKDVSKDAGNRTEGLLQVSM